MHNFGFMLGCYDLLCIGDGNWRSPSLPFHLYTGHNYELLEDAT